MPTVELEDLLYVVDTIRDMRLEILMIDKLKLLEFKILPPGAQDRIRLLL